MCIYNESTMYSNEVTTLNLHVPGMPAAYKALQIIINRFTVKIDKAFDCWEYTQSVCI